MALSYEPAVLTVSGGPLPVTLGGSNWISAGYLSVHHSYLTVAHNLFLITVTTPPAHGHLTLSGAPAGQFTQDDIDNFRVEYHSDGTGASDSFVFSASITTTAGVPAPYVPAFKERDYSSGDPASSDIGGIYFGMMLSGAGGLPLVEFDRSAAEYISVPGAGVTTYPQPITVTNAGSVVLVVSMTVNRVGGSGGSPAPCVVSSLTCPGLTFARLGGSSIIRNYTDPTARTANQTMEVWWAHAPAAFTNTLTVTWNLAANSQQYLWYTAYTGAATPSAPFDANASNFPLLIGTPANMPVTMTSMTPSAPPHSVAPIYAVAAFNGNLSGVGVDWAPTGYWIGGGGGGGTGSGGSHLTYLAKRGTLVHTQAITLTDAPPVEPPRLAMDDLVVTTETVQLSRNLVSLRWSDDGAHTWGSPVTQSIGETGEYLTSLQWQRLGMARDRVFEVSWSVPMPTALLGCFFDATPAQS